jgi:hypothetical protein
LTVTNSIISGNTAPDYAGSGGGIENQSGTLTVIDSTVSGNSSLLGGGGIDSYVGNVTITRTTITGNTGGVFADGIQDGQGNTIPAILNISDSTLSGNTGSYGLYSSYATVTITNSIVAGNTGSAGNSSDCGSYQSACPTNGGGNVVGVPPQLAPLGNYGGLTQTMPPLPGSPAICAGLIADVPSGVTTDQRGFPPTTTYGSNPPCVDSGAVQTNYALSFSTEPSAIVAPNVNFIAAVQLSESDNPFPVSGITIPLTLGAGSTGALSGATQPPVLQAPPVTHLFRSTRRVTATRCWPHCP